MTSIKKSDLEKDYSSGLSMSDIAKKSNVSLHKVVYWMKKFGISSRNRSEASYIKKNPSGNPFLIAELESIKNREILALGIALYLGEGSKTNHGIRLSNSNSKIIKLFLVFLIVICAVKINKVRAWINVFDDKNYPEILDYWVNQTSIPKEFFYSPIIRQRKVGSYKNKSLYGTITVIVDNKKLRDQIDIWSEEFLNKYADMAQW